VFRLEAGDTEFLDCTVPSPEGDPAGSCSRFRHIVPVGSLMDLGLGVLLAPRSFPPTNPRQCWDGDDGPKIDLESTILAGWRQDQEDYGSPSGFAPAAAF
jgi:hypothetical protein